MNKLLSILFPLLFVLLSACASSSGVSVSAKGESKSGGDVKVAEDLSVYRPTYSVPAAGDAAKAVVEPTHHVNDQVAVLMDTVASVNAGIKYAQGYRILAYNGSERKTVMDLRKSIIARVPNVKDYLTYQQPSFRLKIGDFFNRVEAQQVLNQISDLVPNALIVTDQINIDKTY
jgi:hypothetical protein